MRIVPWGGILLGVTSRTVADLRVELSQADVAAGVLEPRVDLVTEHDHREFPEDGGELVQLLPGVGAAGGVAGVGEDEEVRPGLVLDTVGVSGGRQRTGEHLELLLQGGGVQLPALGLGLGQHSGSVAG